MKKYFPGTLAVVLAISLCILQSFTTAKTIKGSEGLVNFNWYTVDANSKIVSDVPVYTNMSKTSVVATDPCKDQQLPNCLYGTNGSVTVGQDISGAPASQRIKKAN